MADDVKDGGLKIIYFADLSDKQLEAEMSKAITKRDRVAAVGSHNDDRLYWANRRCKILQTQIDRRTFIAARSGGENE